MNYGTAVVNFNNTNPFTAFGRPLVTGNRLAAASFGLPIGDRDPAGDGKRRRGAHAGRAQPDGDLRRSPRPSSPAANFRFPAGYSCDPTTPRLHHPDQFKKFGISLELHAGGADRRPHQPAGDDRSFRTLERQCHHARYQARQLADGSLDQDPPRRNHAGNSLRRLDGDGRPDPGTDQAGRSTACPA